MKRLPTITPADMKHINRTAVLELLRQEKALSRSQLSKYLGISLPSIMRIIENLIKEKLVKEVGSSEWSGGRPRTMVELNTADQLAIGIDLSGEVLCGAITNLNGDILFEKNIDGKKATKEKAYELVCKLVDELIIEGKTFNKNIRGIGVGVPGVTEHLTGKVVYAPSLDWKDIPLKKRLEEKFSMPVVVDNDVNMAALGELWFGKGQGATNMVLMNIDTGVGMGIILNNALYRGSNEAAGEIGYLIPNRDLINNTYPNFGALEYLIGGIGLEKQAREILKGKISDEEISRIHSQDVFNAYRDNEEWSKKIIDSFIDYLSMAVITTCSILNPDVLIISGEISENSNIFIDKLKENIKGKLPSVQRVEISDLKKKAYVLGTTIKLLHNTSNYYTVQELS